MGAPIALRCSRHWEKSPAWRPWPRLRFQPPSMPRRPTKASLRRSVPLGLSWLLWFRSRLFTRMRSSTELASYLRVVIGVVAGLGVGLLVTVIVIAAKVGFLVDTPRAAHPFVLAALFAVPALAGGWTGYLWRRPTRRL